MTDCQLGDGYLADLQANPLDVSGRRERDAHARGWDV